MLLSLNYLKNFIDFDYDPSELDRILTGLGIEVESVEDYGKKYRNFFVGEVLEKEKHPDADKLSVCRVNDGAVVRTVVCGAPNVAAGQKIALAVSGAVVPAGGFVIEKRKVRKVESDGMICSKSELELSDDHDGIWVLPETAVPGTPLAEFLGINDVVFEISMTPNRPDCLNYLGIARELSAYSGKPCKMPESLVKESAEIAGDKVSVEINDPDKCSQYTARLIKGAKIQESPEFLKKIIIASGMRPLNAAVDVTNLVMLECGQPLHAFDFDKLAGNKIVVRTCPDGTKFKTLDGKERTLDSSMLMICDAESPVAVAGVMGGENSEITDNTCNILIESAYFKPSSVRKTSKKLGIQSESSYRFERGVDPENPAAALDRAASLIAEFCGGEILGGIVNVCPEPIERKTVSMNFARAERVIGAKLGADRMTDILVRLGFVVKNRDEESVTVESPSHRVDIFDEIDLIEEVVRLNDYDKLEPVYETGVTIEGSKTTPEHSRPALRMPVRDWFINRGFNEILTQNMLDPVSAALFTDSPVTIANPLGEELSIMRPSLVPAMLRTIAHNVKNGTPDLSLFEIGKVFRKAESKEKTFIEGIAETEILCAALCGKTAPKQWGTAANVADFYDIKGIAQDMISYFKFEKFDFATNSDKTTFSKNSLKIVNRGREIGSFGEINSKLLKKFEIETPVFVLLLDLSAVYGMKRKKPTYSKVSPYPAMQRDLAFICDSAILAGDMLSAIRKASGELCKDITLFDVYTGKNLGDGKKSLAFSLTYSSPERTLTEPEVEASVTAIVTEIETKFKAELRKLR